MKAAVLEQLNEFVVRDVEDPEINDDEALMRVEATSICGSDVRIFRHGNPRVKTPTIIGHETAGRIVKVGKNVDRVKVGDHVAIGADVPCGQCSWCRNGLGNNCSINYAMGYQFQGAFAQYLKLPKLCLEEGPVTRFDLSKLSFEEAALAEPLACAINGYELVNLSLGKSVVIIGLGPIGCMMIDLARAMGATQVIGVQRSRKRMEIAQQYGADAYLFTEEEDIVGRCRQLTSGEGPDVVITCCGTVEAHEQAIEMVAHRGYVNLFGGLPKDTRPMNVLSNVIHYKECFVTGSHGCVPRHHELAVQLLEKGLVRVKPLITHRFPLEEIDHAFATMESRQGMKITVLPNGPPDAR
jgi:L-iditol 2-dehydrogenase